MFTDQENDACLALEDFAFLTQKKAEDRKEMIVVPHRKTVG